MPPVGVEVHAGERARAERQTRGLALGEGEARAVAGEHPEVREQVVAEVHGLSALQVGVAGHRPVEVLLGAREQCAPSAPRSRACAARARSRVYIARSVTTWSLRERAVCSRPPTGPTSSVRRRSIAMWMSSSSVVEREALLGELGFDGIQAASSASRSASREIPRAASMRACARDCAMSWGHSRRSKSNEAFRR